jgi:hypothetical protein
LGGAQELYVPAAAHTSGAAGTVWRTDLEIMAKGGVPAALTIELLEERADNSAPVAATFDLEPGESIRLVDVIDDVFGFSGSGALRMTATDGAILATSRTYNNDPDGTYGQYIPALAADSAAESGFDYVLMQLSSTAAYRTNVGFVNTTDEEEALEVELHAASGERLGTIQLTLVPYEMRQVSNIFGQVTGQEVGAGYAIVRTPTDGGRFFAYASVVDNLSGDAVFIPAQLEGATEAELEPRTVVFEAFMRHG